jgi:hypothetical protein
VIRDWAITATLIGPEDLAAASHYEPELEWRRGQSEDGGEPVAFYTAEVQCASQLEAVERALADLRMAFEGNLMARCFSLSVQVED